MHCCYDLSTLWSLKTESFKAREAMIVDVNERLRDPSSCLSWRESSFLTSMSQSSQTSQTNDIVSQDVFNQLLEMLDQSSFHTVQPIELNFSDGPVDGSAENTIQISMDCITMRGPEDPFHECSCSLG
ncbi:hypothetical protein JZ751_019111 [Albula glossodonta]|uniref:Uncharacterized protein n=1 Tax=Albula glossodonta TaxID=121402 RepID=A0A8T2NPP3_9TELE|nr:hypothetical protein JZ751_019111 [Albula glossodonta]